MIEDFLWLAVGNSLLDPFRMLEMKGSHLQLTRETFNITMCSYRFAWQKTCWEKYKVTLPKKKNPLRSKTSPTHRTPSVSVSTEVAGLLGTIRLVLGCFFSMLTSRWAIEGQVNQNHPPPKKKKRMQEVFWMQAVWWILRRTIYIYIYILHAERMSS